MSDDIKALLTKKINDFISGIQPETNKFEVKREWYVLTEERGKNEFFRDTTAMVNSPGNEDAFIVFGISDDGQETFNTNLSDSGYDDPSSISDLVISNIENAFTFDIDYIQVSEKKLCILHMPLSKDKPHVIKRYVHPSNTKFPNEIFTRNGSSVRVATKGDIDSMYMGRPDIVKERDAEVSIRTRYSSFGCERNTYNVFFHGNLVIENLGTRVLLIDRIDIRIKADVAMQELKDFTCIHRAIIKIEPKMTFELSDVFDLNFYLNAHNDPKIAAAKELSKMLKADKVKFETVTLQLANGESFTPHLSNSSS